MKNIEKSYKEIFEVLNKYKEDIVFDITSLELRAKNHLFGIELAEKYGFKIDPKSINNPEFQKLRENVYIGFWDGKKKRISYPDDGRQPKNETLLSLRYSMGAYFFGRDFPTEFFNKFFLELKTYNPKYIDTVNHCLYFSMDNAGKIYNAYSEILDRYYKENKKNFRLRQIKKMKKELSELENSNI